MKIAIVLAVLVGCVLFTQAQRCRSPRRQMCSGEYNPGYGGRGCQPQRMWYYENGRCREMRYRGCGGNNNRYCSRSDCERRCGNW